MSRRKTVSVNVPVIQPIIKGKCRSYTVFCEKMGRPNQRTWVSDWNRGKNLPSPEEAARICEMLEVVPEQILVNQEDVDLVKSLIPQNEKSATQEDSGLSEDAMEAIKIIQNMDPDRLAKKMAALRAVLDME